MLRTIVYFSRIKFRSTATAALLMILVSSASVADQSPGDSSADKSYRIETVIEGLDSPWSLAFLPGGDMLITELGGKLRRVHNGELASQEIGGVPDVYYAGQGGLMDVVLDRDFKRNQRLYLTLAHGSAKANATRLVSAILRGNRLEDLKILFTASPLKRTAHHYGGRVVQLPDSTLLLTVGDGFNYREQAQLLDNHLGKIVRITTEGDVPPGNPWADQDDALPEIWTRGHRNEQAIVVSPKGLVYAHEHGPKGGDEVNLIVKGNNYGWPVITYGIDYNGASITPYTEYAGMQQPLVDWTPSIAPSGMTYYMGRQFPEWRGDLLAVSLKQKKVRRIDLGYGEVISDQTILPELDQRMRDIRTGPDGAIYILTDGDNGKLLRISRN